MPPGCSGAARPEKRVTARSKLPQKKCTGLALPRKPVRNRREHAVDLDQRAPAALRRGGVVGGVDACRRRRGSGRPLRSARGWIATSMPRRRELGQRRGDGSRPPTSAPARSRARRRSTCAATRRWSTKSNSISSTLAADVDRRRAEPARADVERHVPAVVEPGRQREPDLADDLRPAMQGRAGLAPGGVVEHGPGGARVPAWRSPRRRRCGARLFGLDPGLLDDAGPARGVAAHQRGHVLGRARRHLHALRRERACAPRAAPAPSSCRR